jgi:hypothetical protein
MILYYFRIKSLNVILFGNKKNLQETDVVHVSKLTKLLVNELNCFIAFVYPVEKHKKV